MKQFFCEVCNFSSKRKQDLERHFTTRKHNEMTNKYKKYGDNYVNSEKFKFRKSRQNGSHLLPFAPDCSHLLPFAPKCSQMLPKSKNQNDENKEIKELVCQYCNDKFTLKRNLTRHIKKSCKVKAELEEKEMEMLLKKEREREDFEKEKERLHEQIDILIQRVGNTTITNTHNSQQTTNTIDNSTKVNSLHTDNSKTIHLNNFGDENLEMLTSNFMDDMIQYPFTSLPKIIKKVHFNDKHPENKNIRMLNKKDNKLQIRKNDKWEYVDKKNTIRKLMEDKNCQLDRYFEENKDKISNRHIKRFDKFQIKFKDYDKNLFKEMNTSTELLFWNQM